MRIGILGSGMVGHTLALGFRKHNYEVMIGSRSMEKLNEWKSESGFDGSIGDFAETAKFGDILVLATKGNGSVHALNMAGSDNINGKTILDATNPIDEVSPENGVIKFFTNNNESLMEIFQKEFPGANFVKAFSCVGAYFMVNPDFNGIAPTMFICGNSDDAKIQAKEILIKFGWDVEDMGKANAASAIENLCILWCIPGFLNNDWAHAFKLLKK